MTTTTPCSKGDLSTTRKAEISHPEMTHPSTETEYRIVSTGLNDSGPCRTLVVTERSPLIPKSPDTADRLPPRSLALVSDSTPPPEGEGILVDTTGATSGSNSTQGVFDYSSSDIIYLIYRPPPQWLSPYAYCLLDLRVIVPVLWVLASGGLTGTALAVILQGRAPDHDINDTVRNFAWNVEKVVASLSFLFGLISLFLAISWILVYRLNYPRRLGHPFVYTTILAVLFLLPASLGQWCLAVWFALHVPVALLVLLLRLRFQMAKAARPFSNEV